MNGSLFSQVTRQHPAHVVPMRCTPQLVRRLVRHFEDLVVDNGLNALVLQGRCLDGDCNTETFRFTRLSAASRHHYIFTCGPTCPERTWTVPEFPNCTLFQQRDFHEFDTGPFLIFVDAHVAVLFASARVTGSADDRPLYDTVWSFEPDVVFTALEYLHARVSTQHHAHEATFAANLDESAPHSPSLRLTLSLTTKLALLLQRQTEIETTINRISRLVNSVSQLDELCQRIVELVSETLLVRRASIAIWQRDSQVPEMLAEAVLSPEAKRPTGALGLLGASIEAPIESRGFPLGMLTVQDDDPNRTWEPEEEMMLRTIADQLAVGIVNSRLAKVIEEQAMTDELTGLFNRRYFFDRLVREVQFAERTEQPVSLVIVDFEGQPVSNETIRLAVSALKTTLRSVDVLCRFSETSFACILPATGRHGAILAADRVSSAISRVAMRVDVGISAYPSPAVDTDDLLSSALHETRMSRT